MPPLFLAVIREGEAVPQPPAGAISIAFAQDPRAELPFDAVLSLPFSVSDLERTLHSLLCTKRPFVQLARGKILLGGQEIPLSPTEQRLFDLLFQNRHRVVKSNELEAALGSTAGGALSVYLYRLRRKLSRDGILRIATVRGVGYRWMEDRDEQ